MMIYFLKLLLMSLYISALVDHHLNRNSWIGKNEGLSKEIPMVKLL
jgi:hypothetical protein